MLLSNKLKLSVAVVGMIIGTEAFASNNNNEPNEDMKRVAAVPVAPASGLQTQETKFQPQTWSGWLAYKTGVLSEKTIRELGEAKGYKYPSKTEIVEDIEEFHLMGSADELEAEMVVQKIKRDKEEQEANVTADATVRYLIRCIAEAYGDDYDELKPEEIAYLVTAYYETNLGKGYIRLRDSKNKHSKSFDEKLLEMKSQSKSKVVESPKPKYWFGKLASYLITERGAVAIGQKLGITYGEEVKPVVSEKPINNAMMPILSRDEESILSVFARLSEANQRRVMEALEDGTLEQLISGKGDASNNHVEEPVKGNEPTVVPIAPVAPAFVPPAPEFTPVVIAKSDRPASFLDAIKEGKVLKKVGKDEDKSSDGEDSEDRVAFLARALLNMRGQIDGTSLDGQDNNDDWSSDNE